MRDSDEDWPTAVHQLEVNGMRNSDFTSLVPTRATQPISVQQRHEIEISRPAKPPVNLSNLQHELKHPNISEEDMFKDAVQVRKRRVEEYDRERERKRHTLAQRILDGHKELVGICVQMCPRWDRLRRANNKSAISTYEVDENGYFGETRAVKSWHRPAAGDAEDLPEDLRTEETLMKTMDYLVHDIIDKWAFSHCQNFVWDRTRSIRQDCSIQGLNSDAVIECYERIARFHIFSLQQLSHNENFQRGQELEQLSKTLISLNELYDDRRRLIKQGKRQYNAETDFESEFRAYTLVSNLYNPLQIARALQLPSRLLETPIFRIALLLFKYAQRSNHDDRNLFGNTSKSGVTLNWSTHFFDLVYDPSTPYLLGCLAALEFMNVKKGAIKTFERGFPPQKTASRLTLLRTLVDAPSEQEVKTAVERYGLKTSEHDGAVFMVCPRKSQRSTWIAQPPPITPSFPLTVETKRGQTTSGQFVPARFFIDEPGCYRRVVSQLCDEEVDIKYNDPVEHERTTDGPVHIVQFASSWEKVGTIVPDPEDTAEGPAEDALFDLIQNTRNGRVPVARSQGLINLIAKQKKKTGKTFTQAPAKTVKVPAQQPVQRQPPPVFQGFAKIPASTSSSPPRQPLNQFGAPVAPSVSPSQTTTQGTNSAAQPSAPSAFSARPPVVSAFGGPVSAFGTRPAPVSAFGIKPTATAAPAFGARAGTPPVPAFGQRTGTPPVSVFGQKPVESTSAAVPVFGQKSDAASALGAGPPAASGTPPPQSVFQSAASAFPPAGPPISVFGPQQTVKKLTEPTEKQPVSVFATKPTAPIVSALDQKPTVAPSTAETKPTPVSLFNQKQTVSSTSQPVPQGLFAQAAEKTPQSVFAVPPVTLNPGVSSFVPSQTPASKPPVASIFDQPKPPSQGSTQSIFDIQPPKEPITGFFPAPTVETKPPVTVQPSTQSVFSSTPAQEPPKSVFDQVPQQPISSFFPSATPATQPPVSLFPAPTSTPQIPPPESLFPPVKTTTPQVPPPGVSIFDQAPFKAPELPGTITQAPPTSKSPVALDQVTPKLPPDSDQPVPQISPPQKQIIEDPDPIEEEAPASKRPRLAPSGLPLPEDVSQNGNLPTPTGYTYRDVIKDIPSEFIRKFDAKRDAEPWYPGIDSLNKFKYTDIIQLASRRQELKNSAWHKLQLSECNPNGLPALLEAAPPHTWQLQIVCADEGKKSLKWFMNKFEDLVKRDGEDTYRDEHVASSHTRGQDGRIGGIIFGCTATSTIKEWKKMLKHDKEVLQRTVMNALKKAPEWKIHVLVIAYKGQGTTKKAQAKHIRSALGALELEKGGKVEVKTLVVEELADLERLDKIVKEFGVGLLKEKEAAGEVEHFALSAITVDDDSAASVGRKRELDALEELTAHLLLETDQLNGSMSATKRRRYSDYKKPPAYIYGLPAIEKPPEKPTQREQNLKKRKSIEEITDSKKRKVKTATDRVSKALSSVSAKFDAWALPDGDDDLLVGGDLLDRNPPGLGAMLEGFFGPIEDWDDMSLGGRDEIMF